VVKGPTTFVLTTQELSEVTFGIEFEANFIGPHGVVEYVPNPHWCSIGDWDYQGDPTSGTEIRTPIFKMGNWDAALNATSTFWRDWSRANRDIVPHFRRNKYHPSIGGHIHIGNGEHSNLNTQAGRIITRIHQFMPLLYYINANGGDDGCLSIRMFRRPYSPWLLNVEDIRRYRGEIAISSHGTLEFRAFDANIPAIQFAVAFLLTKLVSRYFKLPVNGISGAARQILALPRRFDLLLEQKKLWAQYFGDVEIADLPMPIKEVLVLSIVFLFNPAEFVGTYTYEFSKKAAHEGLFLDAIPKNKAKEAVVKRVKEIAQSARTLGDLFNRIVLTIPIYAEMLVQGITVQTLQQQGFQVEVLSPRVIKAAEKLAQKIRVKASAVCEWLRLNELPQPLHSVLEGITGERWDDMVNAEERYYTLVQGRSQILAVLVIHWASRTLRRKIIVQNNAMVGKKIEQFMRKNNITEGRPCAA